MFVESIPIKPDEHNVCPFGQAPIHSYFLLENKFNGNRTFVGSTCLGNIDPKANAVIDYFKHILEKDVQGTRQPRSTKIYSKIKHHTSMSFKGCRTFNPQVTRNLDGQWEVSVKYPEAETLIVGQVCSLRLKAKYQRRQLTFTAL